MKNNTQQATLLGLRNTKQLSFILDILKARRRPVSVPDLVKSAKKKFPSLNKTTVYRTIDRLIKEKAIEPVMLREGVVHYELKTEDKGHHHHHFVCSGCERIFCLEGCVKNIASLLPRGFTMDGHEIILRGACKDCS